MCARKPSVNSSKLATYFFVHALAAATTSARAVDITWTNGSGDGIWGNSNNWSTQSVPTASDHVILPTGYPDIWCKTPTVEVQSLEFRDYADVWGNTTIKTDLLTDNAPYGNIFVSTALQSSGAALTVNSTLPPSGYSSFAVIHLEGPVTANSLSLVGQVNVSLESGANFINGPIVLTGGAGLIAGDNTALPFNANITLSASYLGYDRWYSPPTAPYPIGNMTVYGSATLDLGSAQALTVAKLIFPAAGTLTFGASAGVLTINTVAANGNVTFLGSSGTASVGSITNAWSLTLDRADTSRTGTLLLTAPNNYAGGTFVKSGILAIGVASGATGSGPITLSPTGMIQFNVAQTSFPTLNVPALAGIGGNLTGAIYSGPNKNVTLAADAVLFPTANAPVRGVDVAAPTFWYGINNPTGSYTIDSAGATSIYKGAAFTNASDITGAFSEAVPGQGLSFRSFFYNYIRGATFNATGPVTFFGSGFNFESAGGTATTFNFTAFPGTPASSYIRGLAANQTVNVNGESTYNYYTGVFGTVNINDGSMLYTLYTGSTTGTYNINAGAVLQTYFGHAPSANVHCAPGSLVEIYQSNTNTLNMSSADGTWLSPNSDVVLGYYNYSITTSGAPITLGQGRRLTNNAYDKTLLGTGVSADAAATMVLLTATTGRTLTINAPVSLSGKTLQVGDTNSFRTTDSNVRSMVGQNGTVVLAGTTVADTINLVAGSLKITGPLTVNTLQVGAATITLPSFTAASGNIFAFNLTAPTASAPIVISNSNGLTLNGGALQVTGHPTGPSSLGYYKIIQYAGALQGIGLASLTRPATADNIAYTADTTTNPGFITLHRGYLGDANDDGLVNFTDFVSLSNNFGQSNKGWLGGDFNGDGTTNFTDFVALSNNFGATLGGGSVVISADEYAVMNAFGADAASAVPEPASLAVLAIGASALLTFRKRR